MPVMYMWCAQTMKERKASTKSAPTIALYPYSGLRVLFAMTSATMPMPGRMSTYTSGCARNQKRCCQSIGLPPPAQLWMTCWLRTRPVGMKKFVPATRSMNCMRPAASSGGKARRSRKAVTNCAQTKKGSRIQVMPGARSWMIVAMKLTEPSSDAVMLKTMPRSQIVCPLNQKRMAGAQIGDAGKRRIRGPAGFGRATRNEEGEHHEHAADEEAPVARHVDPREGHVRRTDLQRHDEIAERREGDRNDPEEDHDRAVHRAESVVAIGREHARIAVLVIAEGRGAEA